MKSPSAKTKKAAKKALPKKVLGVVFRDPRLADAALLHPSHRNENPIQDILHDFDRLEFFGDSILGLVVCRKLCESFPEADEGMLSKLRSILVSRRILSRVAREIKLPKILQLGYSLKKQKDFLKVKVYADALEAFIAAIYLDRGLTAAQTFIEKHFKAYFDAKKLFRLDPNPKSTLQEIVQRRWQKLPEYQSLHTPGGGSQTTVIINRARKVTAQARTRRESEEKAARLMIRLLRQELVGRFKKKSSGKKLLKTL